MQIPNVPHIPIVDDSGNMSPEWANFMSQLITELQLNFNDEGYRLPEQPTSVIDDDLTDPEKSTGAMIYDNITDEFKVNIAGVWKVVTVT